MQHTHTTSAAQRAREKSAGLVLIRSSTAAYRVQSCAVTCTEALMMTVGSQSAQHVNWARASLHHWKSLSCACGDHAAQQQRAATIGKQQHGF